MQRENLDSIESGNDKDDTAALIKGVASYFVKKGYKINGFDAYLTSDVLVGSGLSSSAAFEVAVGGIFSFLFNNNSISPVELAIAGQWAENEFMNKASGLMDQTASAVGGFVSIDFKDPKKPIIKPVEFDMQAAGYSICVVDVNASHANLTQAYSQITREMKEVARFFGKEVLREVDEKEFFSKLKQLRLKVGDRPLLRALHFFGENERAKDEAKFLQENKLTEFLGAVRASGNSSYKYLQNIYVDPSSQAVSLALALSEKILYENDRSRSAVRVHGGGFAGTILAIVPHELLENYKREIEKVFGKDSCHILQIRNVGVWAENFLLF
jgi:galactokinase